MTSPYLPQYPGYPPNGILPFRAGPPIFDGMRSWNKTTSPYVNNLIEGNLYAIEDQVRIAGFTESMMGAAGPVMDPNMAFYQSVIAPQMADVRAITDSVLGPQGQHAGGSGASVPTGNPLWADIAGGAAAGAAAGFFLNAVPVIGQLGWLGCAAIGGVVGGLKNLFLG